MDSMETEEKKISPLLLGGGGGVLTRDVNNESIVD